MNLLTASIGGVLTAFAAVAVEHPTVSPDRVSVVCRCSIPAYGEALLGVRQTLGQDPEIIDLDKISVTDLAGAVRPDPRRVYIAIGREALLAAAALRPQVPIVATMILHGDVGPDLAVAEVDLDVPPRLLFEHLQRLWAYVQSPQPALRQYDRRGAVIEQFGHVGRLDARPMRGSGLIPIPFARAARKDLGIPERPNPVDVDASPGKRRDPRRLRLRFGHG